jgi:putative ABC transport system permease protein
MRGQGQTGGLNRESPAAPRNLGRGQNGSEAAENVEQRGVEAAKRPAYAGSQANRRFTTLLLGLFSIVALALAAIGIYEVVAYSTAQRTQEIGIRMALGARRADVLAMVLKEAGMIGAMGLAVGIAAALALTRFMSGVLFGVGARDPITFVALPIVLLLVTAVATLIPAARAVRVNPVVALRGD